MIFFTYDGVDFSELLTVNDIRGRGIAPSEVDTSSARGRRGGRFRGKRYLTRIIEMDVTLVSRSLTGLREDTDRLAGLLDKEEPSPLVFSDEPTKTYYAILTGEPIEDAFKTVEQFTLTFLCPDPLKYSPESIDDITGETPFTVGGTAPARPITEVTLSKPTTFVAISNGDDVNMVGSALDVEDVPYVRNERVLHDQMGTTTGWGATTVSDDGPVTGTLVSDGKLFKPSNYGTGSGWHGPAMKRPIGSALQDFRIEAGMALVGAKGRVGAVHVLLLAADNSIQAKLSIVKSKPNEDGVYVRVRLGNKTNGKTVFSGDGNGKWRWMYFDGKISLERVGRRWAMSAIRYTEERGWHAGVDRAVLDYRQDAAKPITQVQVHFYQYGTRATPTTVNVSDIKVFKVNSKPGSIPYIAEAGDVITFDHTTSDIYRNGISINEEKAFIGKPFSLNPGSQIIVAEPADSISNTLVRWRDTWR